MNKCRSHLWLKAALALASGALLALAFAPYNLWPLAILSPAVLLLIWQNPSSSQKSNFLYGFLFGLGLFGTGVSWVYISIHTYGHTVMPVALCLTALFIATLALFPALQGLLLARFYKQTKLMLLAFPASWVLLEWFRGCLLTGFPWLDVGYSQINTPLRGFAPLLGLYGLSFLTTLTSILIVYCLTKSLKQKILSALAIVIIWTSGFLLNQVTWTQPTEQPLSFSLIQGNIAQSAKWDSDHFIQTLTTYRDLTLPELGRDLIVWPESAIPLPITFVRDYIQQLDIAASNAGSSLFIGVPVKVEEREHYYNAILSFGKGQGHYYKRHLVPFGEYLPLDHWLRGFIRFFDIPMSSFIGGNTKQSNLTVKGVPIAAFICYEIAYPHLVLQSLPSAHVLLVVSDDSWFGRSKASKQHLQIAQMRALETGRYLLFGTNDGITAVINPKGYIEIQLPPYEEGVLRGTLYPMMGTTPWMSYGHDLTLLIVLGSLLLSRFQRIK